MSDLALLAADPGALEQYADPGQFVIQACERAKTWLQQAMEHGDIDAIAETRAQADAIRIYTSQKQHGQDAVLAAQEIVRRAEVGIAAAIRRGQANGTIARRGQHLDRLASHVPGGDMTAKPVAQHFSGRRAMTESMAMADATDEQFEAALQAGKAVGDLSRAGVVRRLRSSDPSESTATSPSPVPAPQTPAAQPGRPRRPLPDAFFDAAFDLTKAVDRVVRLTGDDRFPRNADQVAAKHRSDLIRARDALAGVLEQLP